MRKIRREMPPDVIREKNDQIFRRLVATQQYRRAKTVVLYVSKELEVDTRRLIKRAWKDGKRVAAPRCVENTRLMNMHLIRSMDDLQEGAFGILEPNENLPILHDTRDAICIVPAFCNDFRGYRVGYGGGYYDRYLAEHRAVTACLCRERLLLEKVPRDWNDFAVACVITERRIIKTGL